MTVSPETTRHRRILIVERAALACAQLGALLWFTTIDGFPLDDAWIHQVVGRTFAETGTLGYVAGAHGSAATSFLWAALMGFNLKWAHVDPVRWAFAMNALGLVATGQVVHALWSRAVPRGVDAVFWRAASFLATLLALTTGSVLWLAHSGMEPPLLLALSVVAIAGATVEVHDSDASRARALKMAAVSGVAGALLVWTRPEGAPLGLLLAAFLFFAKKDRKRALVVGGLTSAGLAAYLGLNLAKTGHAIPATLSGRRWLWFEVSSGLGGLDRLGDFGEHWAERLSSYVFDTGRVGVWLLLGLSIYGAVRLARGKGEGARVLLAWAIAHTASYLVLLPTPGHGGRYQPFLPVVLVGGAAFGAMLFLYEIARLVAPNRAAWARLALVGALPLFVMSTSAADRLRTNNALAIAHIESTEIGAGKIVDALPRDAVVASFDIGGIGWATKRAVLDLGGLCDPSVASLLKHGRMASYLEKHAVRYLVLPEGFEPVLPVVDDFSGRLHLRHNPSVRLERIAELETPFHRWVLGFDATWNSAPRQVVYRIEYTGRAAPPELEMPRDDARRPVHDPMSLARDRDRVQADHTLAILAAWGIPVDVTLGPKADASSSVCSVTFGAWGIEARGCDAVASRDVVESVLYEELGRYLDIGDFGGALLNVPHAIARARRSTDARFDPPLSPVALPGGPRPPPIGTGGGLLLALLVIGVAWAPAAARARRPEAPRREDSSARLGHAALATKTLALVALLALASSCQDSDVLGAATRGRGAIAMALAHGGDIEARDARGRTPLMIAAEAADAEGIALLVARGAKVDAKDGAGGTALIYATWSRSPAAILALASAGTRDAPAGPRARTALHEAVLTGHPPTVEAMIRARGDVELADAFGETPAHLASRAGPAAASIARMLRAAGAGVAAKDRRGFTPLHAAAAVDDPELVAVLASDANDALGARTPIGETALDVAFRYGRDRAADALLRAGATMDERDARLPPLHAAARMNSVRRAGVLLADGSDPRRQWRGKTALDVARDDGNRDVEALLAPVTPVER